MTAIYYDPDYRAIFIQGIDRVWPPGSLSSRVNPDGTVEVWTGRSFTRVAGPLPFSAVTDQSGQSFGSAADVGTYLLGQFSASPPGVPGPPGPPGSVGGRNASVRVVTDGSVVSVQTNDELILLASPGPVTTVLLPQTPSPGQVVTVKDGAGSAGASPVVVLPFGSGLIDGQPSAYVANSYEAITLVSVGTNWSIV